MHVEGYKEPLPGSLETSSLVDMDSRFARLRIFALNLQKEWGGGWILVCSFCVLGNRYRMCPATAPILLILE